MIWAKQELGQIWLFTLCRCHSQLIHLLIPSRSLISSPKCSLLSTNSTRGFRTNRTQLVRPICMKAWARNEVLTSGCESKLKTIEADSWSSLCEQRALFTKFWNIVTNEKNFLEWVSSNHLLLTYLDGQSTLKETQIVWIKRLFSTQYLVLL